MGSEYRKAVEKTGIDYNFWNRFVVPSVYKVRGKKCEKCGSDKRVHVHHKNYKAQSVDDFIVLCPKCHKKEHALHPELKLDYVNVGEKK